MTRKPAAMLAAAVLVAGAAFAQAPPPLEAFATLPAMESPSLSPDGERVAFISHTPNGSFVLVANLDGMAITSAIDTSASKPRNVDWADGDTLLLRMSDTISMFGLPGQFESLAPFGVDLSGEISVRQLLLERRAARGGRAVLGGFRFLNGAQLIGFDRANGRVLFPRFNQDGRRVLYSVDPKTDQQQPLDEGARSTVDWIVDERGRPLFRVDYTQRRDQFTVLRRDDNRWEVLVAETVPIPELDLIGLDASDRLVVAARSAETGRYGLYIMSPETGRLTEPLYVHETADVGGARIDPYTNRVIGAVAPGEKAVWFDPYFAEQQKLLEEAFPGEFPAIVSWSEDRDRMIVGTQGPDRAPAFYLYEVKAGNVRQIADSLPQLQGAKLPRREPYSYTARDGTRIPAYLTRPLGVDGPTPLVLLPHGGPAARDVDGFDWLAHFLASRGYAVLQPNFRGSRGYGREWEEAGHGQWGVGVMQHDLTDGVNALIEAGIADPERVCIVGASYGGYAALAGAVFTPELYRCAAAIAGVADLERMLRFSGQRTGNFSSAVAYWRIAMGVDESRESRERLVAASPALHAAKATAPVLLIHGRDDSVVPFEQSTIMEQALRDAGKQVELVALDGEDHWLSRSETRLAMLQALDRFLGEHLRR